MQRHLCPYLGTLDEHRNPGAPVDYPSFENFCLAADESDTLLLSDQATFCLASGHTFCPRYRAAQSMDSVAVGAMPTYTDYDSTILASDSLRPDEMAVMGSDEAAAGRRRWAWVGAGMIFLSVLTCGALFAAYAGWGYVQSALNNQRQNGQVSSVASAAQPASQPLFVVLTATSAPPPPTMTPLPVDAVAAQPNALTPALAFPPAVTATPAPGNLTAPAANDPAAAPIIVVDPQQVGSSPINPALAPTLDPALGDPANSAPNVDVGLIIPTRRPTPVFDLPTSTPVSTEPPPPPTATPTPLGTPFIVFGAAQPILPKGQCTMVSWNVQNVKEVYYENLGVDGRGQKEECIDDENVTYSLVVVLPDGNTKLYTTTVQILLPTPTIAPTPTFTEVPVFTPTWTPMPPTPTPTLNVRYGVALSVNGGSSQHCNVGGQCDIGLLVTNTGDTIDTLVVRTVQSGSFSPMLCRGDGVCAGGELTILNVGPSNTAFIVLRLTVPADAAPQTVSYTYQAVSAGSNGQVSSSAADISVEIQP